MLGYNATSGQWENKSLAELGLLTSAAVGAANGVAPLDASSLIPSTYLPSYVDDVLEVADVASLPMTGEAGKIYITIDTNATYRWTGSLYVEISSTLSEAEVKSLYEANADTNAFDDAEQAKVAAIPPSPQYTDTVYDDTVIQAAVALNTAKVGITAQQASDITTNNAKVSNVDHPTVETAVPLGAVFTDTVYTHPDSAVSNIVTSDAEVISTLSTNTQGHVTAMTKRSITPANIGALAEGATAVQAGQVTNQRTGVMKFWSGTQAQYDALTPDTSTQYTVVD